MKNTINKGRIMPIGHCVIGASVDDCRLKSKYTYKKGENNMRLGTTPKHIFTFPFETSKIKQLKITYVQRGKLILKKYLKDCEIDTNSVSVNLTQEDTFLFMNSGDISIQVRILTHGNNALASNVYTVSPRACLDEEVLT